MMLAVFRLPWLRLVRHRRLPLSLLLLALGCVVGGKTSGTRSMSVEDAFFTDVFGPVLVPLVALLVVGAVVENDSIHRAMLPLKAWGAHVTHALAGLFAVCICVSAALCVVLAGISVACTHGPADAPWGWDVAGAAYAASLGGAAYGSLFCLGAALGARGQGRYVLFALDLAWGSLGGSFQRLSPQGALGRLLGDPSVPSLGPWSSAFRLVTYAALAFAVALVLCIGVPRFGGMQLRSRSASSSGR